MAGVFALDASFRPLNKWRGLEVLVLSRMGVRTTELNIKVREGASLVVIFCCDSACITSREAAVHKAKR